MLPDPEKYLPLYIGCETNVGKLTGMHGGKLFIRAAGTDDSTYELDAAGNGIKLRLRRLSSLSDVQSRLLIEKGFSIGRPKGYSFSPAAFIFLLDLGVDLFGLIDAGLAEEVSG